MKKLVLYSILLLVTGCGIHNPNMVNTTQNITTVELATSNFKVIDKVSGKSTATYIMGIGGLRNKALLEKAKTNLYERANLTGAARAIIYVTYDTHYSLIFPFYYRVTVTASGYLIEFYK